LAAREGKRKNVPTIVCGEFLGRPSRCLYIVKIIRWKKAVEKYFNASRSAAPPFPFHSMASVLKGGEKGKNGRLKERGKSI